jgi:tRNA A37 methylthiotransferase MiaB
MPSQPQETVQKGTHLFQSSTAEELFILTYSDAESPDAAQQALKVVPEAFAESLQAKISRTKDISIRNNAGREFDFVVANSDSKGRGRVYAVGKRLYMLVTSSKEQNTQQFFNSFRLI